MDENQKKLVDALVRQGYTVDQATEIVTKGNQQATSSAKTHRMHIIKSDVGAEDEETQEVEEIAVPEEQEVEEIDVSDFSDISNEVPEETVVEALKTIDGLTDALLTSLGETGTDISYEEALDLIEEFVETPPVEDVEAVEEALENSVVDLHVADGDDCLDVTCTPGEYPVVTGISDLEDSVIPLDEKVEASCHLVITNSKNPNAKLTSSKVRLNSHWKDIDALHQKAWDVAEQRVKAQTGSDKITNYGTVMAIAKAYYNKYLKDSSLIWEDASELGASFSRVLSKYRDIRSSKSDRVSKVRASASTMSRNPSKNKNMKTPIKSSKGSLFISDYGPDWEATWESTDGELQLDNNGATINGHKVYFTIDDDGEYFITVDDQEFDVGGNMTFEVDMDGLAAAEDAINSSRRLRASADRRNTMKRASLASALRRRITSNTDADQVGEVQSDPSTLKTVNAPGHQPTLSRVEDEGLGADADGSQLSGPVEGGSKVNQETSPLGDDVNFESPDFEEIELPTVSGSSEQLKFHKVSASVYVLARRNDASKIASTVVGKIRPMGNNEGLLFLRSAAFGVIAVRAPYRRGIKNAVYSVFGRIGSSCVNADGYSLGTSADSNLVIASVTSNRSVTRVKSSYDIVNDIDSRYFDYLNRKNYRGNMNLRQSVKDMNYWRTVAQRRKVFSSKLVKSLEASNQKLNNAVDSFKQKQLQESFAREIATRDAQIAQSSSVSAVNMNKNIEYLSRMM